jgi:hypothetical protein
MSELAGQASLFGPSTIAVHNDGDVIWYIAAETDSI